MGLSFTEMRKKAVWVAHAIKKHLAIKRKEKPKPIRKKRIRKLRFKTDDLDKWLGSELVKEGNKLFNNSPSKNDLIIRYLIAKKNWELAMGENEKLAIKVKNLQKRVYGGEVVHG